MSEAFAEAREEALAEEANVPEPDELVEDEDGEPEEGEEAEGEEKPEAKAVDWEKRAHDKEGLAARERSRRREAERRARELEERITRLETTTKKPAEDDLDGLIAAIPDPEEDPVGAVAAVTKIVRAFQGQQVKETEAETRQSAEQQQIQRLVHEMSEHEADFRSEHADYDEAVKHYKQAVRDDLEEQGYAGQGLERALSEHLLSLASRALTGGADPAERVYRLAQKRGFKSGEQEKTEKLTKIAQGAKQASPGGGSTGAPQRMTWEYVAGLKGAARDSAWAKLREQERRTG